ncbi:MAG: hypothetical protein BJ554DRAFT_6774 [Olpidium bornovanus]|uniref:Uncharacterized protein n=1 Tax=Olpidium bornovanus TaxID=278681 RepID=A0A8H7ZXK0_9FUNG|nr:MAG: hypothetical protein BJ554DRAFT_6774 [Olpidium bornovanus]
MSTCGSVAAFEAYDFDADAGFQFFRAAANPPRRNTGSFVSRTLRRDPQKGLTGFMSRVPPELRDEAIRRAKAFYYSNPAERQHTAPDCPEESTGLRLAVRESAVDGVETLPRPLSFQEVVSMLERGIPIPGSATERSLSNNYRRFGIGRVDVHALAVVPVIPINSKVSVVCSTPDREGGEKRDRCFVELREPRVADSRQCRRRATAGTYALSNYGG